MSTEIYERNKAMEAARINDKWYFAKDLTGEWNWHLRRPNGHIFKSSSKGFRLFCDCMTDAYENGYPVFEKSSKNYPLGKKYLLEVEVVEPCNQNALLFTHNHAQGVDVETFFEIKSIAPISLR